MTLFGWLADRALGEEAILRLLLGEGLHGNPTGSPPGPSSTPRPALAAWLADGFPELTVPPASPPGWCGARCWRW